MDYKFKAGDRVRANENDRYLKYVKGQEAVVLLVPGMREYDECGFAAAEEGMLIRTDMNNTFRGTWVFQKKWTAIKGDSPKEESILSVLQKIYGRN